MAAVAAAAGGSSAAGASEIRRLATELQTVGFPLESCEAALRETRCDVAKAGEILLPVMFSNDAATLLNSLPVL